MKNYNLHIKQLLFVVLSALGLQIYLLLNSGVQGDETIWDARGLVFLKSIMGDNSLSESKAIGPVNNIDYVDFTDPSKYPNKIEVFGITEEFDRKKYENLEWPFTIKNPTYHPGMLSSLFIGMSHVFLGENGSNFSLNIMPIWLANRIPGVVFFILSLALIYLLANRLFGKDVALFSSIFFAFEPALVGIAPLARIDMSAIFFAVLSVYSYLKARDYMDVSKNKEYAYACLTGFSIAACLMTNPYAFTLLPALIFIKLMDSSKNKLKYILTLQDVIVVVSFVMFLFILYPNIWPDPYIVFLWHMQNLLNAPHSSSSSAATAYFHLTVSVTAITLWTWFFVICGLSRLWTKERKLFVIKVSFLLVWFLGGLVLLSLVPGKKFLRNFLEIYPAIAVLAGLGANVASNCIINKFNLPSIRVKFGVFCLTFILLFLSVVSWLPYPAYYLWPVIESPQLGDNPVAYVESNGVKDAVDWIHEQGGEKDNILFYTGHLQGKFYHEEQYVNLCNNWPRCIIENKWLVMLPKYTFQVKTPFTPLFRSLKPDHIVYVNKVEMARIVDLSKYIRLNQLENKIEINISGFHVSDDH